MKNSTANEAGGESMQEEIPVEKVGSWEYDVKSKTLTWSDELKRIHEVPVDYIPGRESSFNFCSLSGVQLIFIYSN